MFEAYSVRQSTSATNRRAGPPPQGNSPRESVRSVRSAGRSKVRLQCGRCLGMLDLEPHRLHRRFSCSRCGRRLRLPRFAEATCQSCSSAQRYSARASGRRIKCRHCGRHVDVPVQVARPSPNRASSQSSVSAGSTLLPAFLSLIIAIVGVVVCLRLFAIL